MAFTLMFRMKTGKKDISSIFWGGQQRFFKIENVII